METVTDIAKRLPTNEISERQPNSSVSFTDHERKLGVIIQEAQLAQSMPSRSANELTASIAAWERVLSDIPVADLDPAYERAMKNWDGQKSFGASNIRRAWEEITAARKLETAAKIGPKIVGDHTVYSCWLCEDQGYQIVINTGATNFQGWAYKTTQPEVRPCVCAATPCLQRSAYALQPPDWKKDDKGVWHRA